FEGRNIFQLSQNELRVVRKKMQIIFQDPFSSLNPRMTVGEIVSEPLVIHEKFDQQEALNKAANLLELVGLKPDDIYKYPHEFSGGQAQRIAIARALSINPTFIVADEPVSSLDVSVRAQILNLLKDLQNKFGLTYLFISHDLSVVRHISDRVAVMYLGKIIEMADKKEIFDSPLHPYTQALLSAAPIPDPTTKARKTKILLTGEIPSPINPPTGCRFHPRCPYFKGEECKKEQPLRKIDNKHYVACILADNKN
ncbi:MAG: ATP-binding cassette domain-containing protein, partial [Nitrososphaerota archaeon]